jgi:hypothetical protein
VLSWEDGRRTLIGDDATRITVEPNLVHDGDRLTRLVDEQWPAATRIEMPARGLAEIPPPPAPVRPERGPVPKWQLALVVALALATYLVVYLLAGDDDAPARAAGVIVIAVGGLIVSLLHRRGRT